MAKNQEFLKLIEELQSLKLDTNSCIEALDALIILSAENNQKFVEAVNEHRAFWNQAYRVKHPEQDLFPQELDVANTDLLAPNPAQPDYHLIQQSVITQRAKFAIAAERDEEVLLKILNNNKEECRAYIGRRVEVLENHPKWEGSEIHEREEDLLSVNEDLSEKDDLSERDDLSEKDDLSEYDSSSEYDDPIHYNQSQDVLPDATIETLQKYAAVRFALTYLERVNQLPNEDIEFDNNEDLKAFLQPVGLPPEQIISRDKLDFLDKDLFIKELKFYREKSAAVLLTLIQELEQLDFAQVNEDVLDNKEIFITEEPQQVYDLVEDEVFKYKELSIEDVKKLQLAVGKKYLIHTLQALDADAALPYLNQTAPQIQASLKSLPQFQGHNYIDVLVTNQEDLEAIKKSLLPVCKNKLKADFKGLTADLYRQLDAAATPKNFYTLLFNKGLPHLSAMKPYITDDLDLFTALKNEITTLRIPSLLQNADLQANGAPAFSELLQGLSLADRQELMNQLNAQPARLRSLTTVTTEAALKHFLGDIVVSQNALSKLLLENKQRALINSITNAEVAQVLLEIPVWTLVNPASEITQAHVDAINQAIRNRQALDEASYGQLVKDIEDVFVLHPDLQQKLRQHFGRDPNHPINPDPKIKIDTEQQNNGELNRYVIPPNQPISQNLIDFMLSLKKGGGLIPVLNDGPQLEASLKSIANLLITSKNIDNFAERMVHAGNDVAKANFKQKLTPERYHQLQQELRALILNPQSTDQKALKRELEYIENQIEDVEYNQTKLQKQLNIIAPLNKVTRVDIHNPEYQLSLDKHRAENREMAEICRIAIEELSHYYKILKQHQDNLANNWDTSPHQSKVKKLNSDLSTELDKLTEALEQYQALAKRVAQINTWINDSSITYGYDPAQVKTFITTRDSLDAVPIEPKAAQGLQVQINEDAQIAEDAATFKPLATPKANEVRVFDVVHKFTKNNNPVTIEGRFIYETKPENNQRAEAGPLGIHKTLDNGFYEVKKFPAAPQDSQQEKLAQMKFALTLAIQALTGKSVLPSRDFPIRIHHGKPDEIGYVQAAFKALGQSMPRNMRFDDASIQVSSNEVSPKSAEDYLKNAELMEMIKSCKEQMQARYDSGKHKKVSQTSSEGVKFYKENMKRYKEEAEKRQSVEGPTEIPVQARR